MEKWQTTRKKEEVRNVHTDTTRATEHSTTQGNKSTNKENNQQKEVRKRKITKVDIGKGCNFKHVGHIGLDSKGGFDIDIEPEWDLKGGFGVKQLGLDQEWKKFFDKIGMSDRQLDDKETCQFIFDFVEQHGGVVEAMKELEKTVGPFLAIKYHNKMGWKQTLAGKEVINTPTFNKDVLQPIQCNQMSPPLSAPVSSSSLLNDASRNGCRKLTKTDIGESFNFRHVGHVRVDAGGGFDVDYKDPQWKKFLDVIGESDDDVGMLTTEHFV